MEQTGLLKTVMNEMVDLNLNFDRTFSSNDTVNIGSIRKTLLPSEECSSVNFYSP